MKKPDILVQIPFFVVNKSTRVGRNFSSAFPNLPFLLPPLFRLVQGTFGLLGGGGGAPYGWHGRGKGRGGGMGGWGDRENFMPSFRPCSKPARRELLRRRDSTRTEGRRKGLSPGALPVKKEEDIAPRPEKRGPSEGETRTQRVKRKVSSPWYLEFLALLCARTVDHNDKN